jgi:hypothetical protein
MARVGLTTRVRLRRLRGRETAPPLAVCCLALRRLAAACQETVGESSAEWPTWWALGVNTLSLLIGLIMMRP